MSYANPPKIEKYMFLYHFFPHPEHRRRANLINHKAFSVYLLAILFLLGTLKTIPKYFPGVLGYASNISVNELLKYTNEQREKQGLAPLAINDKLSEAAIKKASHMFKNNYWAHIAPDGTEPWDFILGVNYDYSFAGENLAKNFQTSKDVVNAWYDSPSHRANLLNDKYKDVGFAVVNGILDGYETTLVVQMFGTPRQPNYLAVIDSSPAASEKSPIVNTSLEKPRIQNVQVQPASVVSAPLIDVHKMTSSLGIIFAGFTSTLMGLDIWYSKKKGILKLTGNTFAHLSVLLFILLGVMITMLPGSIL